MRVQVCNVCNVFLTHYHATYVSTQILHSSLFLSLSLSPPSPPPVGVVAAGRGNGCTPARSSKTPQQRLQDRQGSGPPPIHSEAALLAALSFRYLRLLLRSRVTGTRFIDSKVLLHFTRKFLSPHRPHRFSCFYAPSSPLHA